VESYVSGTRENLGIYTCFICAIGFLFNLTPYFFDFRERKSMHPKKRQAIKEFYHRDLDSIRTDDDLDGEDKHI